MEKTRLISRIAGYLWIAFAIVNTIWYSKTGRSYTSSDFLFWGTVGSGLLYLVFHVAYLIHAKKYKELKMFFLWIIILTAGIYVMGYLVDKP